ncbi:hypothetical protein AB0L70_10160 [Kribbella sp. NPDC051952]|uniref:hypothetical protein n=1 Tax=Kribbella sp. NPDC051952 TaxID=3154851 RepID=UPI0034181A1F
MDAEEDQQADQHDADDTAADHQRQLVLADPAGTLRAAGTTRLPLGSARRAALLLVLPAGLLLPLLAPGLLRVATALLRGALTPAATLLSRLALRGLALLRSLTPTALLGRLPLLRRLSLRGLTLRVTLWLALVGLALLRLALLWLLRSLTPASTTLARRLLSPAATLLRRLASLSPLLPAWLAPRLPRTPGSLRRRRHIRSF